MPVVIRINPQPSHMKHTPKLTIITAQVRIDEMKEPAFTLLDGRKPIADIPESENAADDAARLALAWNCHEEFKSMLADAALQLDRLTGESLEVYARTFAVLARAALAKVEVVK